MTRPKTKTITARRAQGAVSVAVNANGGAAQPDYKTIPVLPPSGAMGRDGRGPFNYVIETVIKGILANGADIPVFLDHKTDGAAVGWIDHRASPVQTSAGGWDWPVTYTEEGLARIKTGAYRYTSPTLLIIQDDAITDRQAGTVVCILEVSLVNLPNLPMKSLNNSRGDTYTLHLPINNETKRDLKPMNPEILALLGIADTEDAEAAVLDAVSRLVAAAEAAKAAIDEIAAEAEEPSEQEEILDDEEVEKSANSLIKRGAVFSKSDYEAAIRERDAALLSVNTIKAKAVEHAANAAVDAAIAAGKFVPATRDILVKHARVNLDSFKALAAATPTHPALSPTQNSMQAPSAGTHGLTAEQLRDCRANKTDPAIFAANLRKLKV